MALASHLIRSNDHVRYIRPSIKFSLMMRMHESMIINAKDHDQQKVFCDAVIEGSMLVAKTPGGGEMRIEANLATGIGCVKKNLSIERRLAPAVQKSIFENEDVEVFNSSDDFIIYLKSENKVLVKVSTGKVKHFKHCKSGLKGSLVFDIYRTNGYNNLGNIYHYDLDRHHTKPIMVVGRSSMFTVDSRGKHIYIQDRDRGSDIRPALGMLSLHDIRGRGRSTVQAITTSEFECESAKSNSLAMFYADRYVVVTEVNHGYEQVESLDLGSKMKDLTIHILSNSLVYITRVTGAGIRYYSSHGILSMNHIISVETIVKHPYTYLVVAAC